MTTVFLLQIVRPDGSVVRLPAGGRLERDLIESCVTRLRDQHYVGLLRTQAGVEQAVREALTAAIMAVKQETVALVAGS